MHFKQQNNDTMNIETFRPFFPITYSNWVFFIQYRSKSAFMRLENSWYIEPLLNIFRIEMYIFSMRNTSKLSLTYAMIITTELSIKNMTHVTFYSMKKICNTRIHIRLWCKYKIGWNGAIFPRFPIMFDPIVFPFKICEIFWIQPNMLFSTK